MREIKFRAWIPSSKFMGVPFELIQRINMGIGRFPNDDVVLMQYTGLKDSHAKEEYFGDIIQEEDGTVRIIEDGCSAVLFRNIRDKNDIKYFWKLRVHRVIGNIYENSELLKC